MKPASALRLGEPSFLSPGTFAVACSDRVFRCLWISIVFLHAAHGAVLLRGVYAQGRTLTSSLEVDANLRLSGDRFRPAIYVLAIVTELILSGYHVAAITNLFRYSICARTLSLVNPCASSDRHPGRLRKIVHEITDTLNNKFSRSSAAVRRWVYLYGIRGPYYEHAFHAKEMYEVLWETIQLYQCLYKSVHSVVGYLALGVLVLNCWATPLVYKKFPQPNHRATRFVLCLIADAVQDFTSSILIPYVVYMHYRELMASPRRYDAAWAFTVSTDLVQCTPIGITSILAHLLPSISMVMNLAAIKSVVKRETNEVGYARPLAQVLPQPIDTPPGSAPRYFPQLADSCAPTTDPTSTETPQLACTRKPRWVASLHAFLFMVGLAGILLVTVKYRDITSDDVASCKVVMRHWLVTRVPCAVLEVRCLEDGLAGDNVTALSSFLDKVDRRALRALSFVNCASLVMPDAIRQFPNLNWLEIRNSTLTSWPRSAVLTKDTSPRLGRLLFLGVNFVEFPQALYEDTSAFPPTLLDITFSGTNLTYLPEDLHKIWPQPMESIHFECGHLTRMPSTLLAMRTEILSLAGNAITTVPSALFTDKTFTALSLSNNPIHELPPELPAPLIMRRVFRDSDPKGLWLANTTITSLPEWANAPSTGAVFAVNSPICTFRATGQDGASGRPPSSLRCDLPAPLPSRISAEGYFFCGIH